jgi:hypothetical protein
MLSKNLVGRHAIRDHRDYGSHREAQPSNTGHATHDVRISRDALVRHRPMLSVAGGDATSTGPARHTQASSSHSAVQATQAAFALVAPRARFERAAYCLGGSCSIH